MKKHDIVHQQQYRTGKTTSILRGNKYFYSKQDLSLKAGESLIKSFVCVANFMNAETWTIIKVDRMDISFSKHGVGEKN